MASNLSRLPKGPSRALSHRCTRCLLQRSPSWSPSSSPSSSSPSFSTCSSRNSGSPLFNLTGLANSRETQHFSRERRIPRTEFSPQLQLLRASEVDPFAPAPGASSAALAAAAARASDRRVATQTADGLPSSSTPSSTVSSGGGGVGDNAARGELVVVEALAREVRSVRGELEQTVQALDRARVRQERFENSWIVLGLVLVLLGASEYVWPEAPEALENWLMASWGQSVEALRKRYGSQASSLVSGGKVEADACAVSARPAFAKDVSASGAVLDAVSTRRAAHSELQDGEADSEPSRRLRWSISNLLWANGGE